MSAMKAFMEDEAYAYRAGLEAGEDDDYFALAGALVAVERDADAYAIPGTVAGLLVQAVFEGWELGQSALSHAPMVDIRISERVG